MLTERAFESFKKFIETNIAYAKVERSEERRVGKECRL